MAERGSTQKSGSNLISGLDLILDATIRSALTWATTLQAKRIITPSAENTRVWSRRDTTASNDCVYLPELARPPKTQSKVMLNVVAEADIKPRKKQRFNGASTNSSVL
jgi:hypothetical protein